MLRGKTWQCFSTLRFSGDSEKGRRRWYQHKSDTMTSSFSADLARMPRPARSSRSTPSHTQTIPTKAQNAKVTARPSRLRSRSPNKKVSRCGTRRILTAGDARSSKDFGAETDDDPVLPAPVEGWLAATAGVPITAATLHATLLRGLKDLGLPSCDHDPG